MKIPFYQVDAFTSAIFGGNPAGVCILKRWPADETMQSIAAENNLAETAFVVGGDGRYELRWFTPTIEIDLCGHATLATAHVLLRDYEPDLDRLEFQTQSGPLAVERTDDRLALDLPSRMPEPCPTPDELVRGLGRRPEDVRRSRDYLARLASEAEVRAVRPDFDALAALDCTGIIITAPGDEVDFVSRFFAPRVGVPEDPVTGSAHCSLIPYWSRRLGRTTLCARQVSPRGGELFCEDRVARCRIAGHAVVFLHGTIEI